MTTATAPVDPIAPMEDWDVEPLNTYTDPAYIASGVAFALLSHSQGLGPDMARLRGMELPKDADSEDTFAFLFDLIEEAARIGYCVAQIKTGGFELTHASDRLRTVDMAKAVAALLGIDTVDDGDLFDPEYRAKINRVEAEPKAEAAA